jgi:hypothetical protein
MPSERWARGFNIICGEEGGTGVCLFSSFLLLSMKYARYLMAIWCMFFMRVLMAGFGTFKWVTLLMECSCMAPLTTTVMVTRGLACHCFVGC